MTMAFSFSVISSYCEANARALFRSSSDIEEQQKSTTSKQTNERVDLVDMLLNVGRFSNLRIDA